MGIKTPLWKQNSLKWLQTIYSIFCLFISTFLSPVIFAYMFIWFRECFYSTCHLEVGIKGADGFFAVLVFRPCLALCKKVVFYIKFAPCIQISHDIFFFLNCYLLLMDRTLTIIKGDAIFFSCSWWMQFDTVTLASFLKRTHWRVFTGYFCKMPIKETFLLKPVSAERHADMCLFYSWRFPVCPRRLVLRKEFEYSRGETSRGLFPFSCWWEFLPQNEYSLLQQPFNLLYNVK